MDFFIAYPWAAVVPGILCAVAWMWRRRRIAAATALSWFLYGGYELLIKARVLCSGECNIRVDLLLIYPLLAGLTLASVLTALKSSETE